jgi:septum formation protein
VHAPQLTLASTSPRRSDLLREYGFDFEILTTAVDEIADHLLGPVKLVQENARLKALPVSIMRPDRVVIGADTVVAFEGRILGKPASMLEARAMLESLNGKEHKVHTGVCLLHGTTACETLFVETTRVRFNRLTLDQRIAYHHRINPLDKAGAYAAQDDQGILIASTEGSFTNVIGLPMESLQRHLHPFGIRPRLRSTE